MYLLYNLDYYLSIGIYIITYIYIFVNKDLGSGEGGDR